MLFRSQSGRGEQARPRKVGARQARQPDGCDEQESNQLRPLDDRERAVARLQGRGKVERDPVQEGRQQREAGSDRGRAGGGERGRGDRHHAGDPDEQAGHLASAREATPAPGARSGANGTRRADAHPSAEADDRARRLTHPSLVLQAVPGDRDVDSGVATGCGWAMCASRFAALFAA